MKETSWVSCPICHNKTRIKIRIDTELRNFPLFCPKCKQETLIHVKQLNISVISRVPEILLENDVLRVGQTLVQQFQLHERRCFSSLLIQCAGDGLHAAAADVGGEDQSDCFGRFLHDDNFLCVLVLEVAEGRDGHDSFLLLLPVAGTHASAAIARIESSGLCYGGTYKETNDAKQGTVFKQSAPANTQLTEYSKVYIWVSDGPEKP